MLCGEILRSPQQCLSVVPLGVGAVGVGVNSPYLALLAMATLTAMDADNDDIFLEEKLPLISPLPTPDDGRVSRTASELERDQENGLLSYENPNYHLLHEDQLNSNTEEDLLYYEHLYAELSQRAQQQASQGATQGSTQGAAPQDEADRSARRNYKNLDIGSMGVDVSAGPVLEDTATADSQEQVDNRASEGGGLDNSPNGNQRGANQRGDMGRRAGPDLIQTADQPHRTSLLNVNSAALDGSDIPHIPGQLNNDLYAVAVKRRPPPGPPPGPAPAGSLTPSPDSPVGHSLKENLPPGWERHEDNDGPYFWHIKSGTIQREPPRMDTPTPGAKPRDATGLLSKDTDSTLSAVVSCVTRSNTSSALEELSGQRLDRREEMALKRRSYPAGPTPGANPAGGASRPGSMAGSMGMGSSLDAADAKERPIRFAVRSLGWVEIAEADLTPERSSKAVNKCIVDLSLGRNDLLDVVGRWGDGKDLFMDLDEGALKLIDPENLTLLNTQPIHTIRVWGVGRDHGRDFAYVARDRTTRKHMCHVFRCDIPARTIANTLRDICKKIMIERSLQQNLAKPIDIGGHVMSGRAGLAARPTNLPTEHRRFHHRSGMALVTQSFPTPMEEPRKVIRALYLGSIQVDRATGMDTLNDAIDLLSAAAPQDQWRPVHVAVAPSMISILNPNDDSLITECRVRYLSFLGIGRNVKQCAFVMHTAQDLFIAHAFHCEPSSGALCKTVEAACKLRYQKCLDAHPQGFRQPSTSAQSPGRGLGATLKSLVGTLTGRKAKGSES